MVQAKTFGANVGIHLFENDASLQLSEGMPVLKNCKSLII